MGTIEPFSRRTRAVVALSALALLAGTPSARAASGGIDADRDTLGSDPPKVTPAQTEIRLLPSKNLFFVRIGYGWTAGPVRGSGGLLGLGWRVELLKGVAVDLSFANVFVLSTDSDDAVSSEPMNHGSFSPVAIGATFRFQPLADGTPYAGLGFGVRIFNPEFKQADGPDIRASLGYEMFRVSRLRLFVQADAILPTYKIRRKKGSAEEMSAGRSWPASVSLSLGIGLGGQPDRDARD